MSEKKSGKSAEKKSKAKGPEQQAPLTQEELESKTYEAGAGGGVVTATVSGKKELVSVTIDPEAVDPEDVEMLQDLVVSAVNEALRQAEEAMEAGMSGVTGGLNLGGLGL